MSTEDIKESQHNTPKDRQDPDDFWDVARLLPDKAKAPTYAPVTPRRTPQAVEVELPAPVRDASRPIRTITVQPASAVPLSFKGYRREGGETFGNQDSVPAATPTPTQTPLFSYTPDGLLIHQVKIYDWPSNYHYFDQFMKDAATYASMSGAPAERVSFFSYFPQYAQLNRRQRAWYLYFRSRVREGIYPETDYAYILLYLFELLNLPAEGEDAEAHRDLIAKIWVAYRKAYPQLDHYVCEWLCDYCLIHRLTAPVLHLIPVLGYIIDTARLKEFYLSAMVSMGNDRINLASARILLTHCCHYDYRKSKFYSGEHKALFDEMIPRAMATVFPMLIQYTSGQNPSGEASHMQDSLVSRDAYVGALCAYGNKRRIEVSYISFSRSHDLRFMVGDMVRHIENRIRASILIRSRLTVNFLTVALRKALDAWLDTHLPSQEIAIRRAEAKQPRPDYEMLYDSPHTAVSIVSADAIEQDSWETTKILVDTFSEAEDGEEVTPSQETLPSSTEKELSCESSLTVSNHPLLNALGDRAEFVRAVLQGNKAGQKTYCASHKKLPDAVIDEINDLSVEHEIYDMILETDDLGNCRIIEDYYDMIADLLQE